MKSFRTRSSIALFVLSAMLVGLSGCYKDNFDFDRMKEDMITWEPDIAFPIVYSILDAEKIINLSDSTNIYQYDSDNFITLIYRKRVFSQTVNDFFQFPQYQAHNNSMSLNAAEIAAFTSNNSVVAEQNTTMNLNIIGPGGSQLETMVFHTGTMDIAFTSNFEHSGNLLVTIPALSLNGTPFSQTYPIDYTNGAVNVNMSIPLAGYKLGLNNANNTFAINYRLTLNQGTGSTPTPANQVQIDHSFNNLKMAFVDGYFGNFNLEINPGEVQLDIAQNNPGTIYFEDPRFRLKVKNTIGAEMNVSIDELYATGDPGQLDIDISSLLPTGQFTIPSAPAIGDSAYLEYYFTQGNSTNIKPIVNDGYDKIYYDVSASVNPNGPTHNFASLNSSVEVIADVELPFEGYSDHFTIVDTLEVPFDEAADFSDNVEKGLLRVNTVSHFPVDGWLKLYFADSNYVVIDSVLTDGSYLIRSGIVDADGKTISPTLTNNDIELDRDRIDALFASKYLFISADITTTDDADRNIKLYVEDRIEVRIGLRVKLKASPSDIDDF